MISKLLYIFGNHNVLFDFGVETVTNGKVEVKSGVRSTVSCLTL